eukprot:TRINITY_DN9493_c0_g1_i1.p1 TRINITY_DN9493_c0_g1~~TRINITY_DN9493_c0_g1_i1.p1  ORF type:complete len:328 (-),score=111.84 TRINITY_DN9493_c0_g1_i1:218-1201(-)
MSANPFEDDPEGAAFEPAAMFGKSYGTSLSASSSAANNAALLPPPSPAPAAPPPPAAADSSISFQDFQLGNEAAAFQNPQSHDESMSSSLIANAAPAGFGSSDSPQANPFAAAPGQADPDAKPAKFWHIAYYSDLFNVNTKEVGLRIGKSMVPYPPTFFEMVKPNPDLYGPFWIATTLVFIMAATGNLGSYVKALENNTSESWEYDVTKMSAAAGTVYGYLLFVPLGVWAVTKYYKIGLALREVLCIYGYSFFIWLPISIACVEPNMVVRWILTMGAGVMSALLIVFNFWGPLKNDRKKGLIMLLIMAALQMAFAFVCQLYFFTSYS